VGKTDDEMRLGLRRGILAFNVESLGEVERLRSMARRLARPAPFAVRINPGVDAGTHAYVTTGTAGTKFGMSRAQALPAYLSSLRDGWLRPVGIHCHIGSQITRIEPYRKALKALASLAGELAGMGVRLDHLDIGGGFGISYGGPEAQLDFRELARGLLPMLRGMPRRLILEPGRSLVGPAGVLLTRVLGRKSSGSREFLVVDAAMNDLVRPALYGARHTVSPVHPRPGRRARFDVVGPVCESADFLAKDCLLAPPEPGDLLAIGQSGAYGFSMSSQYNSRPRACEVLVEGGGFRVIRRRETFLDLVRLERGFLRH
jgi:diaminopimelate decarboxylase